MGDACFMTQALQSGRPHSSSGGIYVEPHAAGQQRHSFHARPPAPPPQRIYPPPYDPPHSSTYPSGYTPPPKRNHQTVTGTIVQIPMSNPGQMDTGYGQQQPPTAPVNRGPPPAVVNGQTVHSSSSPAMYCDQIITETFFDVRSPNFPQRYPPGIRCAITIRKTNQNVCHIDLLFGAFDVGEPTCATDYVSVDGERFCGTLPRERMQTFRFDGQEKRIIFDGTAGRGNGYHIRGRQIECGPFHQRSYHSRSMALDNTTLPGDPSQATNRTQTIRGNVQLSSVPTAKGGNLKSHQSSDFQKPGVEYPSTYSPGGTEKMVNPFSDYQPKSVIPHYPPSYSPGGNEKTLSVNPSSPASSSSLSDPNATEQKPGFEYPSSNYVARARLEQIVETRVRVIDSRDGLSSTPLQVSNVVSSSDKKTTDNSGNHRNNFNQTRS